MDERQSRSRLKHFDFMVLDLLCLQACFVLSYWLNEGFGNPYASNRFLYLAVVVTISQLIVILTTNSYRGILRRGKLVEAVAVVQFTVEVFLVVIIYLFLVQQSALASRMQLGCMFVFYLVFDYCLRRFNKYRIYKYGSGQKKSLVLITSSRLLQGVMERLTNPSDYHDFFISGIVLIDEEGTDGEQVFEYGVPVEKLSQNTVEDISHKWVDELFILQPDEIQIPVHLMDAVLEMGITVNYTTESMANDTWPVTGVRSLGGYRVLTGSIHLVTFRQMALKRAFDIVGGFIGSLITLILFPFVAPVIYAKSPGPIFFVQERVGRNGKVFKMYKFRSMYMDAEHRKAELQGQNAISNGLMFKMDDDPRIIGSEKKDRRGNPKGVGNFIRRTSIDEFPQFFNVLKGEMSLVGTRPPTIEEWEKYDLGHRVRMSIKPGITGLWQISGRSEITDFQDVVRLDRTYIESWSPLLDVKILLKTIVVVVTGKGAK